MDGSSHDTLCRIEQNDAQFTELQIGYSGIDGGFTSSDASDYSRLGAAIGNNTHLKALIVAIDDEDPLDVANEAFFDGLRRNSSISDLELECNQHILIGGLWHEILKSYQKINNNLTCLCIKYAVLDNGGVNVITETLRWCRNLETINLSHNNITDEQKLPMVEAIKGGCYTSLHVLSLYGNRIGNAGCPALATLLEHTNCNLKYLNLETNQIGNEGATTIANSLTNNTKLKWLYLRRNPFDPSVVGIFCTVLCNTSSVNDTYCSNHTLDKLLLSDEQRGQHAILLSSLLEINRGRNKSHVAIRKILKYHPNIDMEPLFEWGVEEDDEQNLKALPYVVDWFERAKDAVAGEDRLADSEDDNGDDDSSFSDDYDYRVDKKKLSAIFQCAKAMPLLFEPISRMAVDGSRKRKRVEK